MVLLGLLWFWFVWVGFSFGLVLVWIGFGLFGLVLGLVLFGLVDSLLVCCGVYFCLLLHLHSCSLYENEEPCKTHIVVVSTFVMFIWYGGSFSIPLLCWCRFP